jgi:hypothetical protein
VSDETKDERAARLREVEETRLALANAPRFLDGIDERRVLPCVPEHFVFPVSAMHDDPRVKRLGGMPIIVEGLAENLPGVSFDKPETIPRPVKRVMRALYRGTGFGIVIIVENEAWWIDLRG